MEGFLCYEFGGLIFGGAYFRNFMVFYNAALNAIVHQTVTFFLTQYCER